MQKISEVAYWEAKCRDASRAQTKVAGFGDASGNDVSFEQAFSNLAHSALKQNAPGLMDYEVGFQLVDKNEDSTKAVGLFAFKVGGQWLYAPIFFLNGRLKGTELLYLKNQDMFVPLSEKWLNYLLNRKPDILGDGVTRNSSDLGVMYPDLRSLQYSPSTKYGSDQPENPTLQQMIDAVMPAMAATAMLDVGGTMKKLAQNLNLPSFLKSASMPMLGEFVKLCGGLPEFGKWFDDTYGLDVAHAAIKTAAQRPAKSIFTQKRASKPITGSVIKEADENPINKGTLKVITRGVMDVQPPEGLSPEEQEKLFKDKILIKDERDDKNISIPYSVNVSQSLQNPTESGLYDVLVKPHEFEKCFVAVHALSANGRADFATVIRPGDDANWVNIPASQVWVGSQYDLSEFKEWWESLSEPDTLSDDGATYVLVGPSGDSTLPFQVRHAYGSADGEGNAYEISLEDYCSFGKRFGQRLYPNDDTPNYDPYRDGVRVHLKGKRGIKFRSVRGDIYVPEGFRILKVKKSWREANKDENKDCCGGPPAPLYGGSDPSPLRPGDMVDSQLALLNNKNGPKAGEDKKAAARLTLATAREAQVFFQFKTAGLTISTDGPDVHINGSRMGAMDALVHLVRDHALREKVARDMLKQALRRKYACRLLYPAYLKSAAPYMAGQGSMAPAIPDPAMGGDSLLGGQMPVQMRQEEKLPVPDLSGNNTDPNIYNPNTPIQGGIGQREMQTIQQSMQTGQQEVIDATVISNMLKTVNDDEMIDKYMGPLLHGLDALCRILFFFYWHGEEFADRFGKQDLPELEDGLRNAIDQVGDVAIFVRKKSVDPYPSEGEMDLSLDSPTAA